MPVTMAATTLTKSAVASSAASEKAAVDAAMSVQTAPELYVA